MIVTEAPTTPTRPLDEPKPLTGAELDDAETLLAAVKTIGNESRWLGLYGRRLLSSHRLRDAEVAAQAARIKVLEGARDTRQTAVAEWCRAAFGEAQMASLEHRGLRFLEEAVEAYQACGGDLEKAHKLIDFIFARPVGALNQELGGVGITLLALAQTAQLSADAEEAREFKRVLSKPIAHFTRRNAEKDAAGFAALTSPPAGDGEATDA